MIDVAALQEDVQAHEQASFAPISCVGVITCDRPRQLRRCVVSYVRHIRTHGRSCEFVVLDDSRDLAHSRECREWLRVFACKQQVVVYYAGFEERLEYVRRLSGEGIGRGLGQFVLSNPLGTPSSPGTNRNALLLHAVGESFLSFDDDSVCRLGDLRRGIQTVDFTAFHAAGANMVPVEDRCAAVQSLPEFSGDLLGVHEKVLGRSLSELFLPIRNTSRISTRLMGASLLAELLRGKGRVAITVSGLMGDSGLPDAAPLLTLTGEPRNRLLRFCQNGRKVESCRNVVLGVSRPTISEHGPVRGAATAFDNRFLLPPFTPSGRGEDTFFGILLRKCFDDAFIAHVPVAPLHAPPGPRCNEPPGAMPRLINVLSFLLEGYAGTFSHTREERMRSLGRFLVNSTAIDVDDFQSFLTYRARQRLGTLIEQCEELLELYHGRPVEWAAMLGSWIEQLERTILSSTAGLPAELVTVADSTIARYAKLQKFVREFGEVLYHWPEIVAGARRLRARGYRVGQLLK